MKNPIKLLTVICVTVVSCITIVSLKDIYVATESLKLKKVHSKACAEDCVNKKFNFNLSSK
jgi:hypothetical protein